MKRRRFLSILLQTVGFGGSRELVARFARCATECGRLTGVRVHYFFVPHRLLWNSWEEFLT